MQRAHVVDAGRASARDGERVAHRAAVESAHERLNLLIAEERTREERLGQIGLETERLADREEVLAPRRVDGRDGYSGSGLGWLGDRMEHHPRIRQRVTLEAMRCGDGRELCRDPGDTNTRYGTRCAATQSIASSRSVGAEGSTTTHPLKSEIGRPVANAKIPPIRRASLPVQCSTSFTYDATKFSLATVTS
jgi:hypothetical protein